MTTIDIPEYAPSVLERVKKLVTDRQLKRAARYRKYIIDALSEHGDSTLDDLVEALYRQRDITQTEAFLAVEKSFTYQERSRFNRELSRIRREDYVNGTLVAPSERGLPSDEIVEKRVTARLNSLSLERIYQKGIRIIVRATLSHLPKNTPIRKWTGAWDNNLDRLVAVYGYQK